MTFTADELNAIAHPLGVVCTSASDDDIVVRHAAPGEVSA